MGKWQDTINRIEKSIPEGVARGALVAAAGLAFVAATTGAGAMLNEQRNRHTNREAASFQIEITDVVFGSKPIIANGIALTSGVDLDPLGAELYELQNFFHRWMLALTDNERDDRNTAGAYSELSAYFRAIDRVSESLTPLPPGQDLFGSNSARAEVLDGLVRMTVARGVESFQDALKPGFLPNPLVDESSQFDADLFSQGAAIVNSGLRKLKINVRLEISEDGSSLTFTDSHGVNIPPKHASKYTFDLGFR